MPIISHIEAMRRYAALIVAVIVLAACGAAPAPTAPTQPPAASDEDSDPAETTGSDAADSGEAEPADEGAAEPDPTAEPTPTPDPLMEEGPTEVTFEAADGLELSGTVFGAPAETVVVLVPQYPGEKAGWLPFAQTAADQGWRVLTFDLRGYGDSAGERDKSLAPDDIEGALTFAEERLNANRVILIGAAQGGTASIRVASEDPRVAGLAVISAPRSADGLTIEDGELAALDVPSLWLGARQDLLHEVEPMYEAAGGDDKTLWIYEASAVQGIYLLEGLDGEDLERRLLEFVESVSG